MIEASKGIESTKFSSDLNFGGGSASFGQFGLSRVELCQANALADQPHRSRPCGS